jgi:hypothetical protein
VSGPAIASCRDCRSFEDRPPAFESGLPMLAALSSAHASSRADDGLCQRHQRLVRASASCPLHAPREARAAPPE